ncbi:MAG: hypothetical protein K2L02_01905 [Clostridia bacterium]|nr:hypothetical protein [Clostridia bacterium]
MKSKTVKFIKRAAVAIFTAACLFCLFLPLPKRISSRETYECVWADGSVTKESYSSAFESLAGMDGESVILSRNGITGKIESEAGAVYDTLEYGNLLELLECTAAGTRIDGAAIYREFSDRVWYNGEYYIWTGSQIKKVSRAEGGEIVFLEGNVTSRVLNETNANTVYLRKGSTVSAASFAGSNVKKVYTEAPYAENGGAVYLDTAGGKRLLAALGGVQELSVDTDLAFADEGALLACQTITSLTVPFVGSARSPYGTAYKGEFAHLFSTGKEYRVPETLASVRVTGGRLISFAFYACPNLKEINACGVEPGEISKTAFSGLTSLEILHTPKSDVTLTGSFTATVADCGCTIYIRNHSQK